MRSHFDNDKKLQIGVGCSGKYKIVLDTDAEEFGGHKLLDHNTDFLTKNEGFNSRPHCVMVRNLIYKSFVFCWVFFSPGLAALLHHLICFSVYIIIN